MKQHLGTLITIIFLILNINQPVYAEPSGPAAENVFLVIMNAVRYKDTFGDKMHLYTDNLWTKLRPIGTICTKAYNTSTTYPIPSHVNLLTGTWQDYSGPYDKGEKPVSPTIFEYFLKTKESGINSAFFASANKGMEIASFSKYSGYGEEYKPVFMENKEDIKNRNALYEKIIPYIEKNRPKLAVISLWSGGAVGQHKTEEECVTYGVTDACGGAEAMNEYYESIILMDSIIFDLWNRIQSDSIYKDRTVLIAVSNHGRHTSDFTSFGDNCKGCKTLTFLAVGPGIKKDYILKKKKKLIDICPTIGKILGFETEFSEGRVLKEIFE
jgi:hypothetical protein